MVNLDRLFEMADNSNMCNVKVVYDNGYKEYKVCDGSGTVVLRGDKEEKIFLLFKYPEVYVDEISKYLDNDKSLLSMYFSNPNAVRHELRMKFKTLLYEKAKEILGKTDNSVSVDSKESAEHSVTVVVKHSVEPKPIHKSKTVAFNTTLIITSAILLAKGLAEHNYSEIEKALAVLIPAIVNFILRLVTKHPIKI